MSSQPSGPLAWNPRVELTVPGYDTGHLDPPKPQSSAASHSSIVNDLGNAKYLADSRTTSHAENTTAFRASTDELLAQIGSGLPDATHFPELKETDVVDYGDVTPRDTVNCENVGNLHTDGESLGESIRAALEVSLFFREGKKFLPNNAQKRIITKKRVMQELAKQNICPHELDPLTDKILLEVNSPPSSRSPGKKTNRLKIFAILGLIEKTEAIVHFVKDGLYDSDLPFILSEGERPGLRQLSHESKDGTLSPIRLFGNNKIWRQHDLESFNGYQWQLTAPWFHLSTVADPKVLHYPLEESTILPFIEDEEVTRQTRGGGYGDVWRIKIHPAHSNGCSDSASSNDNPSFAVKRLRLDSYKAFSSEVSSLKRFSEKDHVHLIKLLVTFSWRKQFYLLFPWADGNLTDLWKLYPEPSLPVRNRGLAVWLSEQCLGLVQGLKMIHTADIPSTEDLLDARRNQSYGRHGDLKPENILWFKSYEEHTSQRFSALLKISDFGLMRFHSTRSKSYFESVAVSRTYRPPEYDVAVMVSQSYDVWALGCVLLQFVTWYLLGWEEVENFSQERTKDDSREFPEDVFFNIVAIKNTTVLSEIKATAKKSVAKEFDKLYNHPTCFDFIVDLLKFIEDRLLRIHPKNRAGCEEIVSKFADLHQFCIQDGDYSTRRLRKIPTRTGTALSELSPSTLELSQTQIDQMCKNRLPESTRPADHGRQSPVAHSQSLAQDLSTISQDTSSTHKDTHVEFKGKAPERSSILGTVPENGLLPGEDMTAIAISEETPLSRPQSPKSPKRSQSPFKKAVHFDTKRKLPKDLRESYLDFGFNKDQFPDEPRRNSHLSDLSDEYIFQKNPNYISGTELYTGHLFNSPSGSPAPTRRRLHSVESLELSQSKRAERSVRTSYSEEEAASVPSSPPANNDVVNNPLTGFEDSSPCHSHRDDPEVGNHIADGLHTDNRNTSSGEGPSSPPPVQDQASLPTDDVTEIKSHLPHQRSESYAPPGEHPKATKGFLSLLCFFRGR